jgi:hypothetical protein
MAAPYLCFLAVILLCLHCSPVSSSLFEGSVTSRDQFSFMNRFCFWSNPDAQPIGQIDFELWLDEGVNIPTTLKLALYDDESSSWPAVMGLPHSATCQQRFKLNKFVGIHEEILNFAGQRRLINSVTVKQSLRPRFWFAVLSDCDNPEGIQGLNYKIHFFQLRQSSWNEEFGANDAGLNTLYLVFFLVFLLFLGAHLYSTYKLYGALKYLHPIIKIFLGVLLLFFMGIVFCLIHWVKFGQNGVGIITLERFGQVFLLAARLIFILLIILLASGWTISNDAVRRKWILLGIMNVLAIFQYTILFYQWASFNPEHTDISEASDGLYYTVTVIWLGMAIYFFYTVFLDSYRSELNPSKKSLYLKLGLSFTPWLFLVPLTNLLVMQLDPWVRAKTVEGMTITIASISYFILAFLLWHSRAEKYFQIDKPGINKLEMGHTDYERL